MRRAESEVLTRSAFVANIFQNFLNDIMSSASHRQVAQSVRGKMIEAGGRAAQDLGLGRVAGQILVFLYLQPRECSIDEIADHLGVSRAAISIAARQLESMGVLCRIWHKGDRRHFYRTADNIVSALQSGLLSLVRNRIRLLATETQAAENILKEAIAEEGQADEELAFLQRRVTRAEEIRKRLLRLIDNPIIRLLE